MAIYITQTRGLYGDTNIVKQNLVGATAKEMGISPMSLYYYPVDSDDAGQLSARLDGILSGFSYGDHLIMQWPTLLGSKYEKSLLNKINVFRSASFSKLYVWVNEIPALQSNDDQSLKTTVDFLNQADGVILPSVTIGTTLSEAGLQGPQLTYLQMWDWPTEKLTTNADWHHQTVGKLSNDQITQLIENGVTVNGRKNPDEDAADDDIPLEIQSTVYNAVGGLGVIWPSTDIDRQLMPLQATSMLVAGLPIMTAKDSTLGEFVLRHGCGRVFSTFDDLVGTIKKLSQNDYQKLQGATSQVTCLCQNGWFLKSTLDQVRWLMNQ